MSIFWIFDHWIVALNEGNELFLENISSKPFDLKSEIIGSQLSFFEHIDLLFLGRMFRD